jgi:ABC-type oligopeptide transport system substrate-binding subunit/class 3 adenylate cyclase
LIPKAFAERLLATRGQTQAERRTVTILFSDVKGSTAMAEALDPEDVMEIMDGAFNVLIEPIYGYEGTLARLMGDAILAFFGAPIAHEDDPERACRAALQIVEGARAYAERLEQERGIEGFNVRVGIHTGLVVVGQVGSDLRVEYTAMGDAINLAARLESAAEPGTILVTEDTHRLVAPLFETDQLGTVAVKGKVEPVPVYRVLSAKATPAKRWHVPGLDSPVVGRVAEFSALQAAVDRLRAGVGGIVTVVGDAGIGKSRLVAEVRRQNLAKVSGPSQGLASLRWVEGRCLSYGTSIAYVLWLDVLRGWLGIAPEDSPARVRDVLRERVRDLCAESFDEVCPYLGRLMSLPLTAEEEALLQGLEGERLKAATFHALETLTQCAAGARPLVLVCEDLHWADPTSTELLEKLLELTDRAPLLLICVFRPQNGHGSWRIKETAARLYRHRHTDLWLGPLSDTECETMVSNLLRVEALSHEFGGRVVSRAEGNPFYVEEIIRALINDGAIVRDEATGCWEATRDVSSLAVPDTLHGILTARIDRLEEDDKRVLQMASVIGRIFPHRVLAAIAATATVAWEERELNEHLITLQRQEMIRERARLPEVEYIFKHELTREAAYGGLLKKERRVLHRRVAETLEHLFPDRIEEQVGLLAHHWERAGDAEKAIAYLLRGGDQARMVYAHEEAIDYYQRALVFLKQRGDDEQAARTLMKVGLVHTAAFQPRQAREAYDEGFGLWGPGRPRGELAERRKPFGGLRFAVEEPLTLDPGRAGDDISAFMAGQLFEGLVEVDEDYNVLPAVAARWEMDHHGKRYLFHLHEGLRWSDGTRLTASDFEHAWKRNLDPATSSPVAHLLYAIENGRALGEGEIDDPDSVGVTALDDRTLEVRLEGPTAYLPHLLAHPAAYPVPRCVAEAQGQLLVDPGTLTSNGPYQLLAWQPGEKILLGRNPFYRGRFPGNATRVECPLFTDFGPVLEGYANGALDAVSLMTSDPGTIARARAAHGDELVFTPQLSTFYVVFRVDRPPFDDARVRQAFVHAADRPGLAQDAWQGQYLPATGGFVPPGMPGHSSGIGLAYDPSRARRLLAQAGYPGGRGFPEVTWLYSGGSRRELVVSSLRNTWRKELGLTLRPQYVEWKEFMDRGGRDPAHLSLWGWFADYPDPDNMLRVTFHSAEGFNAPRWHSARFDELVEEAAQITDQKRRMELYHEADRILVAGETAVMPLGYGRGRVLLKPWVTAPRVPPALLRLKEVVCSPPEAG